MGQLKNRLILIAMMLALPLAGLVFFGLLTEHNFNTLPYFTEEGEMEGRTLEAQRVGDFELTNQNGEPFSSESLKGKVWIAAFFGTDAPHVAQVTKQLLWPNFRYRDEDDISVVCFTLNPEHDTPEVLNDYVQRNTRYNGFDGKWQFLTGDKADIDRLVSEDFMIQRDAGRPQQRGDHLACGRRGVLARGVPRGGRRRHQRRGRGHRLAEKGNGRRGLRPRTTGRGAGVRDALPVLGPEGHTVPAFAFMGIDSVEISHRTVEGKVKIVDYFFTHCPTICPIMSSQLARGQQWLDARNLTDDVVLLSHSVDPVRDTPERLKTYATQLGADTTSWKFLTGDKEDLYDHARHGYYLTALESDTAAGGFFHSDTFVLVDQRDRIRGFYDGTSTVEVDAMLMDAAQLALARED